MLLLTISTAFVLGARKGVFMGFAAGLLQDLTTGSYFGCSIFSYMLIGLGCGKFSTYIFKEQFFLPVLTSLPATAFHYAIMLIFMLLFGYRIDIAANVEHVLVPMLIWQLIFAGPIYKLVYEFDRRLKRV